MTDYQRFPDPKTQLREILAGKHTGPKKQQAKPRGAPGTLAEPVKLTLPLPPSDCWPNRSVRSWRKYAKARKWLKAVTIVKCQQQDVPQVGVREATAQATFYFGDKRHRDRDGAASSLKSVWDGLETYGLLENDKFLKPLMPILAYDKENPRLEIVITRNSTSG